jgi:Tfp pilus assembly protein PilF
MRMQRSIVPRHPVAIASNPADEPSLTFRSIASMNRFWLGATALVVFAVASAAWIYLDRAQPSLQETAAETVAVPAYAGSTACGECHQAEHAAWRASQHAAAMKEAEPSAVLGDFADTTYMRDGVEFRFLREGDAYKVRTQGGDGRPQDFTVRYTFGVYPLQQYLLEFPRGRLQSLTIAWDARDREQGGQRWFDLYPGQDIGAGDPLHWTAIDQNWNYQCADCHSTNLRKNFDAATDRFSTTWSEINVGCEACHGPGEAHVAWARGSPERRRVDAGGKGLVANLDERRGVGWVLDPQSGNARRSAPRGSAREIEVCARCHSRRGQFSDDHVAGRPLHDAFRPSLIEPGLYWPDGQMREEVYNYGSFLVSRMAAKGVTCSDCHDSHAQKLRAPGNAVCAQCHLASQFDAPAHHRHEAGSEGAQCAACHMPVTTYMGVDARHDHSFRLPRPDRTASLGVPNSCNGCHGNRDASWAAAAVEAWYPESRPGFQAFAETFAASDRGDGRARPSLIALAEDPAQPPIVRASAIWRLALDPRPDMLAVVRKGLNDPDPGVRAVAVESFAGTEPAVLAAELPRLLDDPLRLVRMAAARTLAGAAESRLDAAQRAAFDAALDEYVAAQRFNADRPEARTNLGSLQASRGDLAGAEGEFRAAIALDPSFVPAWVNLADVQRSRGEESEAEATLRHALDRSPGEAPLHHALGLSLVRSGQPGRALAELETAATAAPESARYAYVYSIALNSSGQANEAISVLERALERHAANRDMLMALVSIHLEAGRRDEALGFVAQLAEAYPNDPEVGQLLQSMR